MLKYVRYSDNIPEQFGGLAMAFIVTIRPKYKEDKGLHAHEFTHVDQFWSMSFLGLALLFAILLLTDMLFVGYPLLIAAFGLHGVLYRFSSAYRFRSEVEAYINQLHAIGATEVPYWTKNALKNKYNLNITDEQIDAAILPRITSPS